MTTITRAAIVGTSFIVLCPQCEVQAISEASRCADQRGTLARLKLAQWKRKAPDLELGQRCTPCADSFRWFRTDRRTEGGR